MKKDKKSDTLAVINNFNFSDIQTDGHGDSMTEPARRAELMKIYGQTSHLVFCDQISCLDF